MWVAAHRSICQSRVVLSLRNSSGRHSRILGEIRRNGPLDGDSNWVSRASSSTIYSDKLYRLGSAGKLLLFALSYGRRRFGMMISNTIITCEVA